MATLPPPKELTGKDLKKKKKKRRDTEKDVDKKFMKKKNYLSLHQILKYNH